jgi:hypothetical protein
LISTNRIAGIVEIALCVLCASGSGWSIVRPPRSFGAEDMSNGKTTIQVTPETRDRLFKLKFRRTYDQFLNELCDLYEKQAEDQ